MAFGEATSVQAKTGYGFKFYYDATAGNDPSVVSQWTLIEGMKSGALPSPDKPEIDVTTTTDNVKAFIPGIGTINDLSIEFNFYPENEVHQDLLENVLYNDNPRPWKIEGAGMVFTFMGYLKSANVSFGVDAALSMPLTLKVTTKPEVTWVEVDHTAPNIISVTASEAKTYATGEEVTLTALFSEAVVVTGEPTIALVVGTANKLATYKSGTGTSSLVFGYTVASGDADDDGIECSNRIVLNGGSIKDAAGNAATLTFTAPEMTGVLVSGA